MTRAYAGSCYCGAIGFTYKTAIPAAAWSIRACQCRFCRCHDALSTSDPQGDLRFHAAQPQHLHRYRFALRTADFLLCRECGVYIGAVIRSGDAHFGIINTHTLQPQPASLAPVQPISYDGEDADGRVGRRVDRWTPVSGYPHD